MATEQLSPVTGVPSPTPDAVHIPLLESIVISTGQEIVGSSLSSTVIVWLQTAIFPAASVTVQTTVVASNAYGSLLLFETLATVQLSSVTGIPKPTPEAVQNPLSESTVMSIGQEIVGSSSSSTTICCTQ